MTIKDIQAYSLATPTPQPFSFSQWEYRAKTNTVVKVTTDSGLVGWGECYGPSKPVAAAVNGFYRERLIGRDPLGNERVWQFMWQQSLDFARKGVMMAAMSGIDLALWDIKGKAVNLPVRTLLGGSSDPVPCYATGMYFRPGLAEEAMIASLLREAASYFEAGYGMIKIKIGKTLGFDRRLIVAMRQAFPDSRLAADANHAYNYKEAVMIGKRLEDHAFEWFEEPLSPEHLADFALLRAQLRIPIAAGECEQTRFGFRALAEARALDIMQPDLAYCGGLTEFQKINGIAAAYGVTVIPHCWGLLINQAAAASALSMIADNPGRLEPAPLLLEHDRTEHPIRDAIFTLKHEVRNGVLHFNSAPGLGVDIDPTAMTRFHT